MKLIPKIYLAFGSILLVFIFVTVSYVEQSENVASDVNDALRAAEIMRLAESMEKAIIDSETGVRGYMVSDNESFLVPFYTGQEAYQELKLSLNQLVEDAQQQERLRLIDSTYTDWLTSFAIPSITLQNASIASPGEVAAFEEFKKTKVKTGAGKRRMDNIRKHFSSFKVEEQIVRDQSAQALQRSTTFTDKLAITLTTICVVIGLVVVYFLAKAIRVRLKEIAQMANEVAQGHFNVQLNDVKNDEISQVSHSLNIMAKRLDDSFASLQKKNQELDQFAYVVSHDLKAPLRAINSLAEWIEEDLPEIDPDVQRNLQLMRGRVFRMENLINGILEYSKIGRKEFSLTTFSCAKLVDEIFDSLSPRQNITWHVGNGLPVITSEKIMLQQVLTNLIGNAIKYNDKPEPLIEVGCDPVGEGYEFWVKDNGPGIPEEYHQKVFGIFQTMESRDTRESTGVGLAIVKKILEEKGGHIRIDSEAGQGSRFLFFWPVSTLPEQVELTADTTFA
ncbi:sensor histidine kinase [Pontibacter sp. MBLB2868]|uniref:sensor histidine kinase n=1 Tax=Pontibacter sp. MBLB2868 TaxID=3451555 RepID=UPI003F753442